MRLFWLTLSKLFLAPTLLLSSLAIGCAGLMDRFDDLSTGKRTVGAVDVALAIAVIGLPFVGGYLLAR